MKPVFAPFFAFILLVAGCSTAKKEPVVAETPSEAVRLLKNSMDKYAAFDSYQADSQWSSVVKDSTSQKSSSKRSFVFQKPNKFKAISKLSIDGITVTSVSDGETLVEYSSDTKMPGHSGLAPQDLMSVNSVVMKHPMFCGSVVYAFFGGSANYANLVDSAKDKPSLGPKEKSNTGEDSQIVRFPSKDNYGHVEVLIGLTTGLVHKISYIMHESNSTMTSTESFSNIKTNAVINEDTFDVKFPKGVIVAQPHSPETTTSRLPIGKPAPDFQVTGLDGKTTSLASLKGQIVLIDFWATWCGPCREGLPITDKLHREFKDRGLKVLAVSDEDKGTVEKYVKENGFAFNSYLDSDRKMNAAYKIEGIPTTVIIDAKGNLTTYIVGLGPEAQLRDELGKLGLK